MKGPMLAYWGGGDWTPKTFDSFLSMAIVVAVPLLVIIGILWLIVKSAGNKDDKDQK